MLNRILKGYTLLGDGFTERVEVDADEVDGFNSVLAKSFHMLRELPAGEDASMDFRVEGLDPAVKNLRESGHFGDPGCVDSALFQ